MHNYVFDSELVRIAILLGVVVSMLFYHKYGATTGGAIVPGYLALFVRQPMHIVVTVLLAIITYWIAQKNLRPRFMLWGRRLFEVEIVVALVLQCFWLTVLYLLTPYVPQITVLYGIGFLLPGIIAHDMGRQGVGTTIWAGLICALVVFGLVVLIGATRDILGLPLPQAESIYHARELSYAYPSEWLLIGIIVSVLASITLFHLHYFDVGMLVDSPRTGGFVTAGYLALFINRPLDILFVLISAGLTYLIVTRFLMTQAILFGRSKMAAMFLTGMLVTWSLEILIASSRYNYIPWAGFNVITPTIVALLANDSQRQGVSKTLVGVGSATLIVFAVVSLVHWGYVFVG